MDKEKEKISLENFNYMFKKHRLTSPLSIQACKMQGVNEDDLIFLTLEEYVQIHPECMNLPKEFQQERYDNFEQNRKDLIETLKEIRAELKETKLKEEEKSKTEKEEYNEENISIEKRSKDLTNDELRRKLYEDMESNIKLQIEKEIEKDERRHRRSKNKTDSERSSSMGLTPMQLLKSREALRKEREKQNLVILKNKMNTIERINNLDKLQKENLIKEEKRKKNIESLRDELQKRRSDEYESKKNKIAETLTRNEERMREKIRTFYMKKQEKEDRIEKREKERKEEMKIKYEEKNKKESERLRAALKRNELMKNQKYMLYDNKLKTFMRNIKIREEKEREKKDRQRIIKELKESEVMRRRIEIKTKETEEIENYYKRKEKFEERLRTMKEDREKEIMSRSNRLYISDNNLRIRHMREENARSYKKSLWLENMNKKRELIKEKREKENEDNAQKRKIKEEVEKDKIIMMERLKEIMKNRDQYTKGEINNYVLTGILPRKNNQENKSKYNNSIKISEIKNYKEDDYGGENAFITGLPEN